MTEQNTSGSFVFFSKKSVFLVATVLILLSLTLASGVGVASEDFNTEHEYTNTSTNTVSHGSFDTNGEEEDDDDLYGPDISIPNNDFMVFYSEKENLEPEELENISESNPNISSVGILSLLEDTEYRTTDGLFTVDGWTFGEYRANQLFGHAWTLDESYQLGGYEDTRDSGIIRDAYVTPVTVHGGAEPDFVFPDEYDEIVGNEGHLLTYTDFYIDRDEAGDDETHDPVNHYLEESFTTHRTDSDGDLDEQTQERDTRHAEQYRLSTNTTVRGDQGDYFIGSIEYEGTPAEITDESYVEVQQTTVNESDGEQFELDGTVDGVPGRTIFGYNDTEGNEELNFQTVSEIDVDRGHYEWERERDRIQDSMRSEVEASTSTSSRASGFARAATENSTSASTGCSTRSSEEVTRTPTRDVTELDGDREFTVEQEVTFTISGRISGTCSGSIPKGGSGTVSSTISGTIHGTTTETFLYDYWDHWNPEDSTDEGGWEIQSEEVERTDSVRVTEEYDTYNTDSNDVDVRQVAVRADDNTYHSIVEIDYEHDNPSGPGDMQDMYYWSMLTFGNETIVESPWGAYSMTEYGGEETQRSGYEINEVEDPNPQNPMIRPRPVDTSGEFPRQVGVNVFSSTSRPSIESGVERITRAPELYGWDGFEASHGESESRGVDSRTTFKDDVAVFTDMVVVKDAPEPASELLSIHGDAVEIEESDTDIVSYAEPNVNIERSGGGEVVTTTVTGVDGEPLSGRDVLVEAGPEEPGEFTTNPDGEITFNVTDGFTHVQLTVEGDDINDLIDDPERDVFYGSVVAERSFSGPGLGIGGVTGELYDLIWALLFASPLILLYLFWRDTRLAE